MRLIEVTSDREFYTERGQHLNWRGKETVANETVLSIEQVLQRKVDTLNKEWQGNNESDSQIQNELISAKRKI